MPIDRNVLPRWLRPMHVDGFVESLAELVDREQTHTDWLEDCASLIEHATRPAAELLRGNAVELLLTWLDDGASARG